MEDSENLEMNCEYQFYRMSIIKAKVAGRKSEIYFKTTVHCF